MSKLHIYSTSPMDELQYPIIPHLIDENSSALEVFTDFNDITPLVVDSSMHADDAERLMISSHVKLKFVVDKYDHFLGIVSIDDLNSQHVAQMMTAGYSRELLTVKDFMQPREKLKAFAYEEICHASIREVIEALEVSGQKHCLVIDQLNNKIRGIISASDIIRTLKLPLRIEHQPSFSFFYLEYRQLTTKPCR